MKPLRISLLLVLAILPPTAPGLRAAADESEAAAQHPDGPVSVEFEAMEDYTDFGPSMHSSAAEQQTLAAELRAEIKRIAPRYIPKDRHLDLRFLDIDMAGEFEPEIAPGEDDVRVVRSVYAPSFLVDYRVTTPSGEVVSKGQRRISDVDFQYIINFRTNDSLFYETELARQLISQLSRSLS